MSFVRSVAKESLLFLAHKSALVRRAAGLIVREAGGAEAPHDTYAYLRDKFVSNGKNSVISEAERVRLIERFEVIDSRVQIATTATDGLFLSEMLISIKGEGGIVECGCYAGGSSAKLSILAKALNRKLIVYDSFEGLPAVETFYLRDQHCRRSDEWVTDWTNGRYAARLEEVKGNVEKFGEPSVCEFVQGWFSETLTSANLPDKIAFAFVDVDLANSARDCFVALWPRLTDGGIFVTHDTAYIKVLQEFYDPSLWQNEFKSMPPIMFGAGFGLCNDSPHLGYMVKGEKLSSEYLKSLTIDK